MYEFCFDKRQNYLNYRILCSFSLKYLGKKEFLKILRCVPEKNIVVNVLLDVEHGYECKYIYWQ